MNNPISMRERVVTQRDTIMSIIDRYEYQYGEEPTLIFADGSAAKDVLEKLRGLNLKTVSFDEITAIVGNDSWTALTCDNCKTRGVSAVIDVGDYPADYETHSARLCKRCVRASLEAMEAL